MAKPRNTHAFVEHAEPLDVARVVALFARCGPERFTWRGPKIPPGERERWAEAAQAAGWQQAYAWDVPGPDARPVRVNFALTASAIRIRGVQPASWFHLAIDLAFDEPAHGEWLAGYLAALGEAFTLPFAFVDTEHHVKANAQTEAKRATWPIMLLGPEHLKRLGELRVIDAPGVVRKIGESYLLQVSEAPLGSRARTLDALATHLGRPARL